MLLLRHQLPYQKWKILNSIWLGTVWTWVILATNRWWLQKTGQWAFVLKFWNVLIVYNKIGKTHRRIAISRNPSYKILGRDKNVELVDYTKRKRRHTNKNRWDSRSIYRFYTTIYELFQFRRLSIIKTLSGIDRL